MTLSTKAYVVEEKGGPFVFRDVLLDEAGPEEVLVEMQYTGLCHTDIVVQQGGMPVGGFPAVLGHEGVGIIRKLGSDVKNKSLREGDQVFLSFRSCLDCSPCVGGQYGACVRMAELNFIKARLDETHDKKSPVSLPDGTPVYGQFFGQSSLSRLAVVCERSVVKCPEPIEDVAPLAPLGCGYLTGAGAVINVFQPKAESKMVVLGMGAVGIAALLAAKALGVRQVIGVDTVEEKLELATSLGATHVINPKRDPDLVSAVRGHFADGADYILDTTGAPAPLQAAIKAVGHGGTLAIVGVPPASLELQVNALDLLLSCKKIIGVIEGYSKPEELIPRLVQLYKDGKFPVDRLCRVYPAADLDVALRDLKAGKVIKPIVSWQGL